MFVVTSQGSWQMMLQIFGRIVVLQTMETVVGAHNVEIVLLRT